MAQLFFCTVSAVDHKNITADIAIPERENMVKTDIPILDTVYHMPSPGETVVAIFDDENGKLQRGVILGRPYDTKNVMEISAQRVRIKQLEADSITYHDRCEKG